MAFHKSLTRETQSTYQIAVILIWSTKALEEMSHHRKRCCHDGTGGFNKSPKDEWKGIICHYMLVPMGFKTQKGVSDIITAEVALFKDRYSGKSERSVSFPIPNLREWSWPT